MTDPKLEVLADLLEERGEEWLATVARHRDTLYQLLREFECKRRQYDFNINPHIDCLCAYNRGSHNDDCDLGQMLVLFGGELEAQRQEGAAERNRIEQGPIEITDIRRFVEPRPGRVIPKLRELFRRKF